jgi:hypothetical protein
MELGSKECLFRAIRVSRLILYQKYDPTEVGNSFILNATLAQTLRRLGYRPELMIGYVDLDQPIIDEARDSVYDPDHMWIVVSGVIVDLASQQFADHFYDELRYENGSEVDESNFADESLSSEIISSLDRY